MQIGVIFPIKQSKYKNIKGSYGDFSDIACPSSTSAIEAAIALNVDLRWSQSPDFRWSQSYDTIENNCKRRVIYIFQTSVN